MTTRCARTGGARGLHGDGDRESAPQDRKVEHRNSGDDAEELQRMRIASGDGEVRVSAEEIHGGVRDSHRQAPQPTTISLTPTNSQTVIDRVRAGTHSRGLIETPDIPPDLASKTVASDELVLVVGTTHPWPVGARASPRPSLPRLRWCCASRGREPVAPWSVPCWNSRLRWRRLGRSPHPNQSLGLADRATVDRPVAQHECAASRICARTTANCDLLRDASNWRYRRHEGRTAAREKPEPPVRIELTTFSLRVRCSTD